MSVQLAITTATTMQPVLTLMGALTVIAILVLRDQELTVQVSVT